MVYGDGGEVIKGAGWHIRGEVLEDFGYPVIPFFSRITVRKSRKEADPYGTYLRHTDHH